MSLVWHGKGPRLTEGERIERVLGLRQRGYVEDISNEELMARIPKYHQPCHVVRPPRMKERPDFDEYAENTLAEFKERAACIRKSYSWTKYWESCSLDDYKADIGRYVDCGNCPLFKDLRETNNTRSFTVIPCDFRGEQVLHVPGLPDEFINEALEKHSPEEMLDYAKRLEFWLEDMRDSGKLVKPPCEEQYTNLSSTTKQTIEMAIHWLRVCSKWELWMATTY